MNQAETGLYQKFNVARTDGRDAPGGDRHGARYFVLDLDHDPHALEAGRTYADECEEDYPQLATDLRAEVDRLRLGEFVTVQETTLPGGAVVPAFRVARHLASRNETTPWVEVNFEEAKAACHRAGGSLITESQWLAIAHQIAQQPENWTGGAVGEGEIYMGLHRGSVSEAQGPDHESSDPAERRWHVLANGERVYDFSGNAFSWVFDDVQGDEKGLVDRPFVEDSPSLTTAPSPSMEKGTGWRPSAGVDWSGRALVRGGCWRSDVLAGVFHLDYVWPDYRSGYVGFRCTLPGL